MRGVEGVKGVGASSFPWHESTRLPPGRATPRGAPLSHLGVEEGPEAGGVLERLRGTTAQHNLRPVARRRRARGSGLRRRVRPAARRPADPDLL